MRLVVPPLPRPFGLCLIGLFLLILCQIASCRIRIVKKKRYRSTLFAKSSYFNAIQKRGTSLDDGSLKEEKTQNKQIRRLFPFQRLQTLTSSGFPRSLCSISRLWFLFVCVCACVCVGVAACVLWFAWYVMLDWALKVVLICALTLCPVEILVDYWKYRLVYQWIDNSIVHFNDMTMNDAHYLRWQINVLVSLISALFNALIVGEGGRRLWPPPFDVVLGLIIRTQWLLRKSAVMWGIWTTSGNCKDSGNGWLLLYTGVHCKRIWCDVGCVRNWISSLPFVRALKGRDVTADYKCELLTVTFNSVTDHRLVGCRWL